MSEREIMEIYPEDEAEKLEVFADVYGDIYEYEFDAEKENNE
jgi:hypothetical protein